MRQSYTCICEIAVLRNGPRFVAKLFRFPRLLGMFGVFFFVIVLFFVFAVCLPLFYGNFLPRWRVTWAHNSCHRLSLLNLHCECHDIYFEESTNWNRRIKCMQTKIATLESKRMHIFKKPWIIAVWHHLHSPIRCHAEETIEGVAQSKCFGDTYPIPFCVISYSPELSLAYRFSLLLRFSKSAPK